MTRHTVVQFVCFTTPLPRLVFTPAWVPFASTFLAQGLQQIVLAERIGQWLSASPAFDYVSRNVWPEEAFMRSLQAGRIGDGAGGPVRAEQGGTFQITEAVPGPEQPDREKVIALLRIPDHNTLALSTIIKDAFAAHSDVSVSVYQDSVTSEHQRFDLSTEIYGAQGQGAELATHLEAVIAGKVNGARSSVGVYREVLTLPPLHKS